jgi:hypothetical protein
MPDPPSHTRPAGDALAASLAAVLVLTAACADNSAAGGGNHQASSSRAAPPAAPAPVSGYHTTATALARRITSCRPQPLTPQTAAGRLRITDSHDIASAAACTLRGRTALILTFADQPRQAAAEAELRDRVAYYAAGPGWSAAPTDTSEPVGQQSVVQGVALALGGRIETGGS